MNNTVSAQNIYANYLQTKHSPQFAHVQRAVELIEGCLSQSLFQHFYVSFNGGKDATIVLFLTFFAMRNLKMEPKIKCLYFKQMRPFPQTEEFIQAISSMISIQMIQFETKNYPIELNNFKNSQGLDWVVMGTRKDDPGCSKLGQIAQSNVQKGYPAFKRVNPIIDWSFSMVWNFILGYRIPYCTLYDQGYTYLGNKDNTLKNQELYDAKNKQYKKAFEAKDEHQKKSRGHIKPNY